MPGRRSRSRPAHRCTSPAFCPRPRSRWTASTEGLIMFLLSSTVRSAVGLIVIAILLVMIVASRYKVAGPNEAYIVTGRKGKPVKNVETGEISTDLSGQRVVMGGGIFVVPFVQKLHILDLSSRRIMVQIRGAVSGQGIKLNLDGVAIVKVGGNEDSID